MDESLYELFQQDLYIRGASRMESILCAACGQSVKIARGRTEMRLEPHRGDDSMCPASNVLVIDG
ncbi:hypothetical protein AB0E01_23025 [Nocardia vinacea]|uniref:hypothetical protein n=1 Tax=Nocardia vinacea TaxID=96468 RepID=UPI0033D1D863